jgi:hypothetical protein
MPRFKLAAALLVTALASVAIIGSASGATAPARAGKKLPFTLRGAQFRVRDHRLTYTVTICTPVKSVLAVRANFAPAKRAHGVITLTPGTTQYQDRGCWPVFVSAATARSETKHCKPINCPAIRGRRYRSTVIVTIAHPHETRRAPRLHTVA